ncbi:MAG: hypothetical protein LBU76_09105 [Azoarcus sp.]|nr:hypothetical protein [Azoarcus sp.]
MARTAGNCSACGIEACPPQTNEAAVARELGLLTGGVQQLHAARAARIDDIRADVCSLEAS